MLSLQPLLNKSVHRAFKHWHKLVHVYKNLKEEKPDHLRNAA